MDIRIKPRPYIRSTDIRARISAWISVLRISEREVYSGYPWLNGYFHRDIRNFMDVKADVQVYIQADIHTDSSARELVFWKM